MYNEKRETVKKFNRILLILVICYACFSFIVLVRLLHSYMHFYPEKEQWELVWANGFNGSVLIKWMAQQMHDYLYFSLASDRNLIFFYLLFTCFISLFSLMVLTLANMKSRWKALTYIIYFLCAKTTQLFFLSYMEYQNVNFPFGFRIYQTVIAYSLESLVILFLPRLVNKLFMVAHQRQINSVFSVLFGIGLVLIIGPYFFGIYGKEKSVMYLQEGSSIKLLTSFKIYQMILWSSYLYTFLVATFKLKTINNLEEKKFDIRLIIILLIFAFHNILPVIFFPENMFVFGVGFFSLNILLLKFVGKSFFEDLNLLPSSSLPEMKATDTQKLTDREKEVLLLLELGLTSKSIGDRLYISETTVKTHLKNIYHKFGVNNRTRLLYKLRNITGSHSI